MHHHDSNYQNDYEGGDPSTYGKVKTRKPSKRGGWKSRKYREGRRAKREAEQWEIAENGEAKEREEGEVGIRYEGLRSHW